MSAKGADLGTGRTGGRDATTGVIPGRFALSVGMPDIVPPKGWKWTPLSSVAQLESGHTPSRKHPEYWDGDVPWIGIKDATENHGRTIHDTYQHVTELGLANSSARLLPANTICLSRTASVGFVVRMGRPMATSQDFVNWVCGPNIDADFLKYILLAEKEALWRFASGTTHQTIYYPEAKAFHVCLPPITEQKAIASILGALDDKIELNRRMNATLEAMARALFQSWFVAFDPVRAKLDGRPPTGLDPETAALFPAAFQDSPLGHIPEGWEAKRLTDVIEVNPRRVLKSKTVAPYLDMKNLPSQGHCADKVIDREFSSGTKFQNGDTLLARITPCLENGKTGFVDFLEDGQVGWGSTEYIVFSPKQPLPPQFGYYLARSDGLRTHAIQNMTGTSGRQRVPSECFSSFLLAMPTPEIVLRFEELTNPLMKQIKGNTLQSNNLAALRDSLLPKLLSGELSVKDGDKIMDVCA